MKRFSLSLATIPRRDDMFNIDFNVGEYPNNFDAVLKKAELAL